MPISAQQWRLAVGRVNVSRSLRPCVTGQPKIKWTSLDVLLFILTTLLGAVLSGDGGRGTRERKGVSRGSGGGGGTVGELAPSLLTAPWRKELLMLAGDVETNPGPFTDYDLFGVSLVAKELTAVSEKWQYIGEKLGVEQSSLSNISTKHSDPGDCLKAVLRERIRHSTISWKHIVAVLRTPRIGEPLLADHLEGKYCSTAQQILQEALEKGYVDCHIWKVLVTGAAGSGKTSLKHHLFGEEPPSLRCSTALAEAAIRAISREIVGTSVTGWFRVTYAELMEMLGGALKAGVPMEKSPSGVATGLVAQKQSTRATTPETKQPQTHS